MTIYWQLIPLILTAIVFVLFQMAGGNRGLRSDFQLIMGGLFGIFVMVSLWFYVILGIIWTVQQIHIV